MPHPNADRLVLCRLNDGSQELIVLTGAPNLFEFKGKGPLGRNRSRPPMPKRAPRSTTGTSQARC